MRWGPRIPPRLFALALIPIGGVAFFATQNIREEMSATEEARALLVDADSLESLWHATTAIETELAVLGVVADTQGEAGAPDEATTSGDATGVRHITDTAIADLTISHADTDWVDPDGVARLLEALQAVVGLRADASTGSLTPGAVRDVDRLAETAVVTSQVAQLREVHEVDGEDLVTALNGSGNSIAMIATAANELRGLAAISEAPADDASRLRDELRSDAEAFDAALAEFEQGLPASEQVEFAEIRQQDAWLAYDRWRTAALELDGTRLPLVEGRDSLLAVGVERIALMESFSDELVDKVAERASDLEEEATSQLRSTLAVALVVLGFTAVACVVTARTIVRPLRRLENRARSISHGELERDLRPRVGPADIVAVESAIDSLTDNLVVLERQAAALAVGDLAAPVFDEVSPGRLGQSIQDSLRELRSLNSRLEYEANHDALTGLFNRAAILSHLERSLTGRADARSPIAVVMVDLDGFKHANDTMGHHLGDELLCHVANRLSGTCAPHRVGRLGGDEFMIVVDSADDFVPLALAERVVESLRQPYATTEGTALLSAGAGIASTSEPMWLSPTEVLMRADLALREAKQRGRGELVVFDQRLHDRQYERMRIQGELRVALDRDELKLHFQPIFDIGTGEPVGVEALLRWFPPGRPSVPPSVFISAAEQSELIVDIDNWVVREACRCLGAWTHDPALAGLRMSINVSGRHLSSADLVASVHRALEETQANPELLIIEATETELIPNLDQAVSVLEQLKDLGVTVAIDDFGTGYASVAHLRRVEFGELKIDRTFIANLDSVTDRSIADLLVSLGRDLQLDVVAEGIETSDQLAWAEAAGCTHAQGFFLARPEPEDDMRDRMLQLRATFSSV